MTDAMPQSTQRRPEVMASQEIRKFTGEALREPIPWPQHPAWTVHAQREERGETERIGITPPPAFTSAEIRAMIAGPGTPDPCPRCGYVAIETR